MTISIYPTGYVQDLIHSEDKKFEPHKHYLTKDRYSSVEAAELCSICAREKKWNERFEYDAQTDTFIKKDSA